MTNIHKLSTLKEKGVTWYPSDQPEAVLLQEILKNGVPG